MEEIKNNITDKLDNFENKLSELINKNEIKMKPKWHFVLKTSLIGIFVISLFLLLNILVSFVIFQSRVLPPHEMREIFMSLRFGPPILFSILLLGVIVVFVLHNKFDFAYKRSSLFVIFSLLLITFLFSMFIDRSMLHDRFDDQYRRFDGRGARIEIDRRANIPERVDMRSEIFLPR